MRRAMTAVACLAVLLFASAGTAMAGGPHHHGHRGPHYRHDVGFRGPYHKQHWRHGVRRPVVPFCATPPVRAYPVYPAPVYNPFSQFGFGVAGRNFSLFFQQ